jgi:hypothetical protein
VTGFPEKLVIRGNRVKNVFGDAPEKHGKNTRRALKNESVDKYGTRAAHPRLRQPA